MNKYPKEFLTELHSLMRDFDVTFHTDGYLCVSTTNNLIVIKEQVINSSDIMVKIKDIESE